MSHKEIRVETRKDMRKVFQTTHSESVLKNDFHAMARQLNYLDGIRGKMLHSTRSEIENKILRNSERYPEVLVMMRDKDADRKKTAKLKKIILEEEGFTTEQITELSEKELCLNPTYQLFEVGKTQTEKLLSPILDTKLLWTRWLQELTGVSILTASKLLYYIGDVTRFSQPSKLITYCGLAVNDDGEPQRKRRGEECNYKPELKSLILGVIADNFMRSKSPYREIYDSRKEKMMRDKPELGKHPSGKDKVYMAHYHSDAKRVMVKRFIHELWDAGWLLSGVQPPSKPYAVAILGHDMEPKVVPVNSERGYIYSWSESGVLDGDRRILYDWKEWQEYVDSLNNPTAVE